MDSKTKKVIIITTLFFIVLVAASWFKFISNNSKDFEYRTGTFFCKINIINENNIKVNKWDIGIAKNNTKSSIIENESNRKSLEKFLDTISDITTKRLELFIEIAYLLFVLIIFSSIQNDNQILKNMNHKKVLQIITIILVAFLIYKISISYVKLGILYEHINIYFKIIP